MTVSLIIFQRNLFHIFRLIYFRLIRSLENGRQSVLVAVRSQMFVRDASVTLEILILFGWILYLSNIFHAYSTCSTYNRYKAVCVRTS